MWTDPCSYSSSFTFFACKGLIQQSERLQGWIFHLWHLISFLSLDIITNRVIRGPNLRNCSSDKLCEEKCRPANECFMEHMVGLPSRSQGKQAWTWKICVISKTANGGEMQIEFVMVLSNNKALLSNIINLACREFLSQIFNQRIRGKTCLEISPGSRFFPWKRSVSKQPKHNVTYLTWKVSLSFGVGLSLWWRRADMGGGQGRTKIRCLCGDREKSPTYPGRGMLWE